MTGADLCRHAIRLHGLIIAKFGGLYAFDDLEFMAGEHCAVVWAPQYADAVVLEYVPGALLREADRQKSSDKGDPQWRVSGQAH